MKRSTKAIRRITACAVLCTALALPASASAAFVPLATYGTGVQGGGAGQLHNPEQAAVDEAGNLFVGDVTNSRVDQFSANGAFVRAWGWGVDTGAAAFEVCTTASGCQPGDDSGGEAGQLGSPFGVASDGAGHLFVSESSNDRISVFTTDGTFVRAFGYGVDTGAAALETCTPASGCQPGINGDAAGQLSSPEGITLDGGNLFIADSNHRVAQFTTGGAFVRAFGYGVDTGAAAPEVCTAASTCQAGASGPAAGQLGSFDQISTDGAGSLFVADGTNNRVDHFTTIGTFVRAWGYGVDTGASSLETCTAASTCQAGITGPAAGQFNDPIGVAADGAGNVYVAEQVNNRASQFTASGAFVRAWGFGVDTGAAAFELCTTASGCQIGLDGSGAGQLSEPRATAIDCRGAIYVVDAVNSNVKRFGEQGTASPPCSSSAALPSAAPSNDITLGKVKLNKDKGTATLTVAVPGPGTIVLSGKGLVKQRPAGATASKAVGGPGKVTLLVKAKGKKKAKLNQTGKVKVTAKITYTPTGGSPNTESKSIRLKKNLE